MPIRGGSIGRHAHRVHATETVDISTAIDLDTCVDLLVIAVKRLQPGS
jgi:hypothetical protein